MGLFSALGVGGGSLTVQLQNASVQPGGVLQGMVVFTGGRRAQQLTSVSVKLTMSEPTEYKTPDGNTNKSSQSRDLVPAQMLAQGVTAQPGQVLQYPFQLQVPPGVPPSQQGGVSFRVHATADIPGEIDPGAGADVQVLGGAGGYGGYAQQQQQQQPGMMGGMQPPPMGPAPLAVGSPVLAQWQDGNWYPGRVVALQQGMVGVDWDNPALGQNTWVAAQQVQPAQGGGAMGKGADKGAYDQGYGKQADPGYGKQVDKGAYDQGYGKQVDKGAYDQGYGKQADKGGYDMDFTQESKDEYLQKVHSKEAAAGYDQGKGYDAGKAAAGKSALGPGARVYAQAQDGNWYTGTVSAESNGMLWVQFDNGALGGAWVAGHQVQPA